MKDQYRYLYAVMILVFLTVLLIPSPTVVRAEDGETPPFERTEPAEVAAAARAPSSDDSRTAAAGVPPLIDVWYDTNQVFGHLGNPQRWINIPGKGTDGSGVSSLKYALNGGSQKKLNIGPDGRRLVSRGDFNIEIDRASLNSGPNTVVITARDTQDNTSTETVTLEYQPDNVWLVRYSIDWSEVAEIQDVAQVVDGQWRITSKGLRTQVAGYDRLVAIGDVAQTDYEVQVLVTVHSVRSSGSPGVGLLMRWKGHTHAFGLTPHPQDAILLAGYTGTGVCPRPNVLYWFVMEVEELGTETEIRAKVWPQGTAEPVGWQIQARHSGSGRLTKGRIGLWSHSSGSKYRDDIVVRPVGWPSDDF